MLGANTALVQSFNELVFQNSSIKVFAWIYERFLAESIEFLDEIMSILIVLFRTFILEVAIGLVYLLSILPIL